MIIRKTISWSRGCLTLLLLAAGPAWAAEVEWARCAGYAGFEEIDSRRLTDQYRAQQFPIDAFDSTSELATPLTFQSDSIDLEHAMPTITGFARLLRAYPDFSVAIRGYVDSSKTSATNRPLWRCRSLAVDAALTQLAGPAPARVEFLGLGSQASAEIDGGTEDTSTHRVELLLRDPQGVDVTALADDLLWRLDRLHSQVRAFVENERTDHARILVATVPNPDDTRLARHFDIILRAGIAALEDEGYLLESMNLPWKTETGGSTTDPTDWERNLDQRLATQKYIPGLATFRSGSTSDGVVVLFVGENPRSGVSTSALNAALETNRIAQAYAKESTTTILGPTYSGSAQSLRDVLARWASRAVNAAGPHTAIYSGTATSPHVATLFSKLAGYRYSALVRDDEERLRAIFELLRNDMAIPCSHIAILFESSAYGSTVRRLDPENENPFAEFPCETQVPPLYPFPMHIASSPIVAEDGTVVEQQASWGGGFGAPKGADSGRAGGIPTYSLSLTPESSALTLDRILNQLSNSMVEVVGIVATDVDDIRYLANAIHEHTPDVRLFTLYSDVLFTHPAVLRQFRSMFVAQTFSLDIGDAGPAPRADGPAPADSAFRRYFANEIGPGFYQATRRALRNDTLEESATGGPTKNLAAMPEQPSVSVAVVTRTGIQNLKRQTKQSRLAYSRTWVLMLGGWALVSILIALLDKPRPGTLGVTSLLQRRASADGEPAAGAFDFAR